MLVWRLITHSLPIEWLRADPLPWTAETFLSIILSRMSFCVFVACYWTFTWSCTPGGVEWAGGLITFAWTYTHGWCYATHVGIDQESSYEAVHQTSGLQKECRREVAPPIPGLSSMAAWPVRPMVAVFKKMMSKVIQYPLKNRGKHVSSINHQNETVVASMALACLRCFWLNFGRNVQTPTKIFLQIGHREQKEEWTNTLHVTPTCFAWRTDMLHSHVLPNGMLHQVKNFVSHGPRIFWVHVQSGWNETD